MPFKNEQYLRDLVKGMRLRGRQYISGDEQVTENYGREMYDEKYDTLQGLLKKGLHECKNDGWA